jgi:hypothetical protein
MIKEEYTFGTSYSIGLKIKINNIPQPSFLSDDLSYLVTHESPDFNNIRRAVGARYKWLSFRRSMVSQYRPGFG